MGEGKMKKAILIDMKDNVATVTSDVEMSEEVEILSPQGDVTSRVKAAERILFGHKLALKPLDIGTSVIKYGEITGTASASIAPGEWVHTHNVESGRLSTRKMEK
jgi:hypothetical protein